MRKNHARNTFSHFLLIHIYDILLSIMDDTVLHITDCYKKIS